MEFCIRWSGGRGNRELLKMCFGTCSLQLRYRKLGVEILKLALRVPLSRLQQLQMFVSRLVIWGKKSCGYKIINEANYCCMLCIGLAWKELLFIPFSSLIKACSTVKMRICGRQLLSGFWRYMSVNFHHSYRIYIQFPFLFVSVFLKKKMLRCRKNLSEIIMQFVQLNLSNVTSEKN